MSFLNAFEISTSGLSAERFRINVISSNVANINTTRTAEGGPYVRKDVLFLASPVTENKSFSQNLDDEIDLQKVEVKEIVKDQRPPILKYDPSHPDANSEGYVAYPHINIMEEMVNLVNASRSYEANATTLRAAKDMAMKSIEIIKG